MDALPEGLTVGYVYLHADFDHITHSFRIDCDLLRVSLLGTPSSAFLNGRETNLHIVSA